MFDVQGEIAEVFAELEDHVGSTLGPDGRNVLINNGKRTFVTKDGVTVVKSFRYPEAEMQKNMIVDILSEMSRRTDSVVGDGTTSTVVFAEKLYEELYKYKRIGFMPTDLLNGAKIAIQEASRNIAKFSYPVASPEEVEKIAFLSSNGDKTISEILSSAFEYIGKTGAIVLSDNNAPKPFSLKIKTGFSIKAGLPTKHFITNEAKKTCEMSKPYVLVTDYGIMSIEPILEILRVVAEEGSPLLIVCDFIDGDALKALIENIQHGTMQVAVISAPYFDKQKKDFFEDISVYTGATLISKVVSGDLYTVGLSELGRVESVEIGIRSSLLVGGKGSDEEIKKHVEFMKELLNESNNEEELESLNERILRFGSGVAEISVGGSTEAEVIEKRFRIDDALMAINSSLTSGFSAGGGTTYLNLARVLKTNRKSFNLNEGEDLGYKAAEVAMFSVLNRLLKNSEISVESHGISQETIKEKLIKKCKDGVGFDFRKKKFKKIINCDNPEDLIIEPSMIIENVLANSLSIVTLLLKTERILWNK